jgi:hypothetical protein
MRAARAGTRNMGSTLTALICQLMSGDLVVMMAYPTATICHKKGITRNHLKTQFCPDPRP